jgi:hypothetical protein
VPQGTVWALPPRWITIVVGEDTEITFDKSASYTSDRIACRAIMRVGFGIAKLPALLKITVAA